MSASGESTSTTASFITTFMSTLGNFIEWIGSVGSSAFTSIGNGVTSFASFILGIFNFGIAGMTSGLGKVGEKTSDGVNETVLKESNTIVDFIIGIKDCIMHYLFDPIIAMLNLKNASYASVIFLMLIGLCVIAGIIYGGIYFAKNIENNIENIFKKFGLMIIGGVILISAFLIFYKVLKKYKQEPGSSPNAPSNNTFLNKIMILIVTFICILIFVYKNSLKDTLDTLSAFPVTVISIAIIALLVMSYNQFYFNKYSIQLAAFIILVAMGIYYNPFSLFTTHVVPSMIMSVTIFSVLVLFMRMHSTTKDTINSSSENGIVVFIKFISYAIFGGLIAGGAIYAHEKHYLSSNPMFYTLLIVTLAIIYKGIGGLGYASSNPFIGLLMNVIFYIPCILVDLIDYFSKAVLQTYSTTSKTMVTLLVIEIVLLMLYLIVPYVKNKLYKYVYIGGNDHAKLLVNNPLRVNTSQVIASFVELNCPDMLETPYNPSDLDVDIGFPKMKKGRGRDQDQGCKYDYNYGLSMWFNMDAISPSSGAAYNEATPIFKYGDKMMVKYNPSINTLTVEAQTLDETKPADDKERNKTKVVYKNENVALQKWNHLVINYSSGYVDVFLNGKLDGAEIKIIPFMRNDSLIVGTKDGISGRVTGLIYYKYQVSAMAIKYMYEKFKTGTPPKFPEDTSLFSTDIFKNSTYR